MAARILVSIEGVFADRQSAAEAVRTAAQRIESGERIGQQAIGTNPWVTITEYGDDE